ncbi:MAG: hypothetical protein JKX84_02625 [Flavobacteriales bacterium]|nr:hypothetical protein [Flavobacteriales bacterium]
MKYLFKTIILLLSFSTAIFAHGEDADANDQLAAQLEQTGEEETVNHDMGAAMKNAPVAEKRTATFDEFPSLHPMVVHFPVVLLLIAAISAFFGLFVYKKPLSWVTLFLCFGGLAGAYAAGQFVHPHTAGLTENAKWVLTEHERFASYTVWLAGIAFVMKIVSHFFLRRKMWSELIVVLVLAGATFCVSQAGHLGAQLTYLEGVGVQGNFIEMSGHGEEHSH